MDTEDISIQDLKRQRPDLYQAIKQEICLGELRLTKDDIVSLIEPLSENIKEYLRPYMPKLSTMTYNDIVDMGNDIIDEISEQLLNEFEELECIVGGKPKRRIKHVLAPVPIKKVTLPVPTIKDACKLDLFTATIEDIKRHRPDLCGMLYDEFVKAYSLEKTKQKNKTKEEKENDTFNVKLGDVLRWNYTKEEGIVVGFDSARGKRKFIVEQFDGTKIMFENDPKLFRVLEGKEKETVITKREKYIAESKERETAKQANVPKNSVRTKTIYDGVIYNEPTRRGSKLKVGDRIRFKLTKDIGIVKGFFRKGGLDRIHIGESNGLPESIIDNPEAYEILVNN